MTILSVFLIFLILRLIILKELNDLFIMCTHANWSQYVDRYLCPQECIWCTLLSRYKQHVCNRVLDSKGLASKAHGCKDNNLSPQRMLVLQLLMTDKKCTV